MTAGTTLLLDSQDDPTFFLPCSASSSLTAMVNFSCDSSPVLCNDSTQLTSSVKQSESLISRSSIQLSPAISPISSKRFCKPQTSASSLEGSFSMHTSNLRGMSARRASNWSCQFLWTTSRLDNPILLIPFSAPSAFTATVNCSCGSSQLPKSGIFTLILPAISMTSSQESRK